jgi:uncharacterized protein (DUF3820 family)
MEIVCKWCGLLNDYNTVLNPANNGLAAICNGCGRHIKFLPQNKPVQFYIGKYKGTKVSSCDDKDYLKWFLANTNPNDKVKQAVQHRIKELN